MSLHIVMYHYVRDVEATMFPGLKALGVDQFDRQLDYFQSTGRVVSGDEASTIIENDLPINDELYWLTFDDGFSDHFEEVFPRLVKRGISGTFFPPTRPIMEGIVLDVHKIQIIVASIPQWNVLDAFKAEFIDLKSEFDGLPEFDELWSEHGFPDRLDSAEVSFVKRMLQFVLPEYPRGELCSRMFSRATSLNEAVVSCSLYLNENQIREMVDSGMEFGSHSHTHQWLNTLSRDFQREDIESSLAFLRGVGVSSLGWFMCYPFGGYNAETLMIMDELNCRAAMTTTIGSIERGKGQMYKLPRRDAIEFV
jgi:peptidoglycan/xylan/chitin deacetylase (PgdA/CDA1 family)